MRVEKELKKSLSHVSHVCPTSKRVHVGQHKPLWPWGGAFCPTCPMSFSIKVIEYILYREEWPRRKVEGSKVRGTWDKIATTHGHKGLCCPICTFFDVGQTWDTWDRGV